jgi:TPR repeat protein
MLGGVGVLAWGANKPGQVPKPPPSIERQFQWAIQDFEFGQWKDGYDIMFPLAKTGDANAQFDLYVLRRKLALFRARGEEVDFQFESETDWLHCAAEGGDREAQYLVSVGLLGLAAELSQSRTVDKRRLGVHSLNENELGAEGRYWLDRSVAQEYPDAQYYLAQQYLLSDGDKKHGWRSLQQAADQGHDQAHLTWANCIGKGTELFRFQIIQRPLNGTFLRLSVETTQPKVKSVNCSIKAWVCPRTL